MNLPRLIVAGLKGGAGKTIVALGLLRAWHKQGLRAIPFKKGPDYIDAAWLSRAANRPCYNLDPFLMSKEVILKSFAFRARMADISVVEGNRGLFDGVDELGSSSTAELAKCLNAPVILVLDCSKVTRTAAALVLGCQNLDPELDIEGVILNNVATSRHENIVRKTVERYTGLPVLGALSRMKEDPLPMRHLGVTPCDEYPQALEALDRLGKIATESLDIHRLREIAGQKGDWVSEGPYTEELFPCAEKISPSQRPLVGIIRDEAFQFYYPENLEALERAGAKLIFLDALRDKDLPELDALYVGGGFPETQAARLSANETLRNRLCHAIYQGLPVYAECGGLMYLGRQVIWHKKAYPMIGAIGWDFVVGKRPVGHGYTILEVISPNPFYKIGTVLRGHEFHYSRPVPVDGGNPGGLSCRVLRGHGFERELEGLVFKNVFGTYTHIHALGNPEWAICMTKAAMQYMLKSQKRP
ncbi:MAG: cobyrinate a,c-diamide synthase [Nitrospiraceae bacterium]|nr:cobyrinate a,c-diamide synthase [Nitrospiraceae bacterium]